MRVLSFVVFVALAALAGFCAGWLAQSLLTKTPRSGLIAFPGSSYSHQPAAKDHELPDHWLEPAVHALFQRSLATEHDCRSALEEAEALERKVHPLVISALRDRALRAWLQCAPATALTYAERSIKGKSDVSPAHDLFRVWLDLDVESALSAFSQASPALSEIIRDAFLGQLAQVDPARALEAHPPSRDERPRDNAYENAVKNILTVWASKDPKAAAERALAENETAFKLQLPTIAAVWAERSPMEAWAFFNENGRGRDVASTLAGYLLAADPEMLDELTEAGGKATISEGAEAWAERDPEGASAFAFTRAEDDPWRVEILTQAARALSTADPEGALTLLSESGGSSRSWENDAVYRESFASLAANDPDAAWQRWREMPAEHQSQALAGILTYRFAENRDEACRSCRELLANPETADQVIPALSVALSWGHGGGAQDLTDVLAVLPELEDHVSSYLLEGWVKTAPEAAATMIAEKVLAAGGDDIGDPRAVAELAFSRPEFTAQWLSTLPEGIFRNRAAAVLAANWSRFDSQASSAWVESLSEGPMKAAAISHLGR